MSHPVDGPPHVVVLVGDLDVSNAPRLRAHLQTVTAGSVVLDLTDLTFMDSSGIAVLLEAAQRGITITLRNPSEIVRTLVDVTGLTNVLRCEP
jgi:anti-sigma B factor antagonist